MRFDGIKPTLSSIESGEFDKSGIMINGVKHECNEDTYQSVYDKIVKERDGLWDSLQQFDNQGNIFSN